jgi:hypothetical protein
MAFVFSRRKAQLFKTAWREVRKFSSGQPTAGQI